MPAGKFEVINEDMGGGVVLCHVKGDVDAHTTKLLQASVAELYSQGKYKLIVDFSHVKYMSSSGASLLILMQTDARAKKGDVLLLNVKREVKQVLAILGLDELFAFHTDKKAALAQFKV